MKIFEKISDYFNRPKLIDFYNVFHQLYMLLTSGSTLQQSLQDIAPYQEKKTLKEALLNISKSLTTGISTGAAFRREPIFPGIVAPSLEAGDRAGELSKSLFQLSEMMYLQHNLYSKVNGALFVPKMSAVLMSLMVVAYIKIAIPEFVQLYKDNNIEIPFVVSLVSGIVNGIVDNWYVTLVVLYLIYRGWIWFSARNVPLIDSWKLKLPIYKKLHYIFLQHQFASIISLMLGSGLTVPDALVQAQKVVGNTIMADAIGRVRQDIKRGISFTQGLIKNNSDGIFDKMLIASINAGERSDNLSRSLDANCKYYERTLVNMIDPVSTKITLLVLIPMGMLIVAMYVFTMIPMFSYMSQIQ